MVLVSVQTKVRPLMATWRTLATPSSGWVKGLYLTSLATFFSLLPAARVENALQGLLTGHVARPVGELMWVTMGAFGIQSGVTKCWVED